MGGADAGVYWAIVCAGTSHAWITLKYLSDTFVFASFYYLRAGPIALPIALIALHSTPLRAGPIASPIASPAP